jgi:hypothetical protein
LLLFKRAHLILEHFALQQSLTLMLQALQLDALRDGKGYYK